MKQRFSYQGESSSGILYLVATPIGNLDDMTFRAVQILRSVPVIAAEDTRQTRKLLNHFEIDAPRLISYHEHNKRGKEDLLLSILAGGEDVALVTDAGTPGISDPGADIVRAAVEQGYAVAPIPGAVAGIAALIASGLPTDTFTFIGFLPREKKKRLEALRPYRGRPETLIFYESPHRIKDTVSALHDVLGNRPVVLGRELTKRYEEFSRGKLSDAIILFSENEPRGEYVLLVGGHEGELEGDLVEKPWWDGLSLSEHVERVVETGVSSKEAVKLVAKERGLQKREVYNEVMRGDE